MFRNDYSEIAADEVLKALVKHNKEQNIGYGLDKHSKNAERIIKKVFDAKSAAVHFIAGGTQTNMLMISYILRPYEAVISADTGHINVHETGAVEGSGHKIYTVKNHDGKISGDDVVKAIKHHVDEHQIKPKMVYISNSTETGTIYSKKELEDLYNTCKNNGLYLFIDGARLGSALTSSKNDLDVKDIAKLCDAFYIGGTKNGALFGEALVIVNKKLQEDFRFHIKNKGAMLAKGFVLGITFETLFKNGLYFRLAENANKMATLIKENLIKLGYDVADSPTNQLFVTVDSKKADILMNEFGCELWNDLGNQKVIRFVTSFKTSKEDVIELIDYIKKMN